MKEDDLLKNLLEEKDQLEDEIAEYIYKNYDKIVDAFNEMQIIEKKNQDNVNDAIKKLYGGMN